MSAANAAKRESLNLRIREEDRALIDRAARLRGTTRTDFVISAARSAAEDALLDQTLFVVDEATHAEFLRRLDAPGAVNERLAAVLRKPAPWDLP